MEKARVSWSRESSGFSSKKDAKVAVFIYGLNEKDFKNRFLKRQKETKACGASEP